VQIVEMRELIKKLKGDHTILISSHILPELSQICDRLLIIQNGEIVAQGTEEQLAGRLGGRGGTIQLELVGPAQKAVDTVKAVPGVTDAQILKLDGDKVQLEVLADVEVRPLLAKALVNANLGLLRLDRSHGRLEDIFLKLTHGTKS
jgi:ABC-2 type transport system ATP-binding protein